MTFFVVKVFIRVDQSSKTLKSSFRFSWAEEQFLFGLMAQGRKICLHNNDKRPMMLKR